MHGLPRRDGALLSAFLRCNSWGLATMAKRLLPLPGGLNADVMAPVVLVKQDEASP